ATLTRTWVATDAAGNSTTVDQIITILDNIAPVANMDPADVTVVCGTDIPAVPNVTFTDNCDEFTVDFSEVLVSLGSPDEATLTRTWVATDAAGNSTTVDQIITILDNIAPVANMDPADVTVSCGTDIPAVPNVTFTDNCDEFTVDFSETLSNNGSTDEATLTRTWVATDAAGNSTTVDQVITINDTEAPVASMDPADVTVNCGDEIPAVPAVTFTDNCDEVTVDFSETTNEITFGSGIVLTRTWVATDAAGNSTTVDQVVTVLDTVDPTIVCSAVPTDFNTDPGQCSYKVTDTSLDPTASDNCGVYTVTHNYPMAPQSNSLEGAQFPLGMTSVGFTVTDAAGNAVDCTITVNVTDNEAPTFVNCPTTMVMVGNDVDECSGKLNWSVPVATDNCGIQLVAQTGGPASGTAVPVGTAMTVTYTATDVNGNASTCMFDVQVIDTQDPEFDADIVMPGDITVECDAVPAAFVLTNDDVHDNCTASANLILGFTETSTQSADANSCDHYNYTITRTWTIEDEAGNVTTHIQTITVQDTTAPTPSCTDQTITLDLFGNASIDPTTVIAGTTDNCAPFSALTATASKTDFDCSDVGTQQVTLTISDPCGNTATCVITVNVVEGDAPCTPEYDVNGSDPCVCLDNATTLENGQFGEVIVIHSLAGQTWTVVSSTGLYTTTSPAPPASPTPMADGTALTAFGNGTFYRLEGRHVDAIGFTVTLTNGSDVFTFGNTCHYPTPDFTNVADELCLGTVPFAPEVTDLYAGDNAYTNVDYFVDGTAITLIDPVALGIGQHIVTATVNAGTAGNSRFVNGVAIDTGDPRLDPGCEQSISMYFQVVATPTQVTCNDQINLTIEPDCESEITPDQVLEGSYACFDDYSVELYLPNGTPLNPSNVVTSAHIGWTLNYVLVHPISGNTCWGTVTVEDKNAPEPFCPQSVDILCVVDPDSIVYWVPPSDPDYPTSDYWGNLVPFQSSLLYLGEPTANDCSSWTWEYTDDYTTFECAQDPALIAHIVRTFVITDEWGNQATCTQDINWKRGEANQVVWPTDYHINCNSPLLAAVVASDYSPDYTGWPYIWGPNDSRLSIYDNGICGLGLTYEDQRVNLCASEYKIVRTWTLYDWCPETGNQTTTEIVQNIKVVNVAPIISVICDDYDAAGNCILNATEPGNLPHNTCYAIYVPYANIDAGCDELVSVTVETPAGDTGNGGAMPAPGLAINLPGTSYNITYRAQDQCGNISELVVPVVVRDLTAPIAVCDEITSINLGSDGLAVVDASVFDDGSYDGCCLDQLLVRRMQGNGCDNTSFKPNVTFCCNDLGDDPVMVVFRATDCNGNYNDCMVEVNVQDKSAPVLISCPANQRVDCDWYADNLETQLANADAGQDQCDLLTQFFGNAEYYDNCDPEVDCSVNIDLDQCLEGRLIRTWTAIDDSGNTNSAQNCRQTIWVDHVSDWSVEFPADIFVECGTDTPDFGEPIIFKETCELVAVSYEDELFDDVPGACYKILRTWSVINWCVVGEDIDQEVVELSEAELWNQGVTNLNDRDINMDGFFSPQEINSNKSYRTFRDSWNNTPGRIHKPTAVLNPTGNQNHNTNITDPDTDPDSDPWDGFITYQQVIKVNDTVDPVFSNGCDMDPVCIGDNTCAATVTLPTPDIDECSSFVTFQVSGDLGTGFGPFFNVAPGEYDVRYVAMDNCNNQTACETVVTVVDCKKPTPYCKNGIVVELMVPVNVGDVPMVDVWASDLDANSFDNCPGDLIFSFSSDVTNTFTTFTCDEVGQNAVEIWVTDAAGNQDFCETVVTIQANMVQCDPDDPQVVAMGGAIATEANEGVQDVSVQLSGAAQMTVMTDIDGAFNFNVDLGGDYTITPSKDDNPLNGVTTYDLVLISKHVLGVQLLDSPYKLIAADANNSQTVTTFDIVQIRKLILYIDQTFQSNTSWRFVDKGYVFPNTINPWEEIFPEVSNYNNVDQAVLNADFVAVKIGDVNGSAQVNFADAGEDRGTVGSLVFNVEDERMEAGQTYTVDFKANDFDVQGYQFTLNFDQNAVEFVDVKGAVAGPENFGYKLLDKGVLTASWNGDDVKLAGEQVIFSLEFKALDGVKLSDAFVVNSRYTVAEAYDVNSDLLDVELAFSGAEVVTGFELYQNTPNPFSKGTVIGFTLPEASSATLTITDVSGKVVTVKEGEFSKGYNEFKLERKEFNATGILYYQIDTDTDSATKMMILID
ncbi:MAG TPA: HYR domain-containing protein, partial [Bacteroidetes bacterium]|nr:HYR domain-containing protein [Bacteroidota bacterium]